QSPGFQENYFHPETGAPLRNEIMNVRPLLPADVTEKTQACRQTTCYRVEMYSYPYNLGLIAVVDVDNGVVVDVSRHGAAQPDLNQRLTDLAVQIAIHSPEVQTELGIQPEAGEATMPNTKTALNGSRCENSRHLCVAPTFLVDGRALFAIVDLTEERLVGVRWTEMGESGAVEGVQVTERMLQSDVVMANYCEKSNPLARHGWEMEFVLTSSDGLQVNDVRFQGKQALNSAKLVDWHVSYSKRDGFGYSDAIGCPEFSSASIVAFNGPYVEDILDADSAVIGFALAQDFLSDGWPRPCFYRYQQRYEFYRDGRFRIVGGNLGRGCGNDATYRPVYRIDITASPDGVQDTFAEWNGAEWAVWETEQWQLQAESTVYTPEGYQYRVTSPDGAGFYIEPGQGQFGDGGRGDNAYVYVTRHDPNVDEGTSDMITIGPCCNTDHQQGPEKYIEPAEPIAGENLVIWYVGQLKNDDTPGGEHCWADMYVEEGDFTIEVWPCYYGPMFVPIAP
ncbi:MAG: hypothetical protein GY803_19430, partial [Chloroflexi bacterium]|nr:hypothetical protein [Chloroflexota bacterium]